MYCTELILTARGSILHNFYNHCYYLLVLFRDKVFSCPFSIFEKHLRAHDERCSHYSAPLPAALPSL